jgi:hypothetical protein
MNEGRRRRNLGSRSPAWSPRLRHYSSRIGPYNGGGYGPPPPRRSSWAAEPPPSRPSWVPPPPGGWVTTTPGCNCSADGP